jgi:hypothetical protein
MRTKGAKNRELTKGKQTLTKFKQEHGVWYMRVPARIRHHEDFPFGFEDWVIVTIVDEKVILTKYKGV